MSWGTARPQHRRQRQLPRPEAVTRVHLARGASRLRHDTAPAAEAAATTEQQRQQQRQQRQQRRRPCCRSHVDRRG
eukprot:350013-Chlamydomonas_euryale.AAC.4